MIAYPHDDAEPDDATAPFATEPGKPDDPTGDDVARILDAIDPDPDSESHFADGAAPAVAAVLAAQCLAAGIDVADVLDLAGSLLNRAKVDPVMVYAVALTAVALNAETNRPTWAPR